MSYYESDYDDEQNYYPTPPPYVEEEIYCCDCDEEVIFAGLENEERRVCYSCGHERCSNCEDVELAKITKASREHHRRQEIGVAIMCALSWEADAVEVLCDEIYDIHDFGMAERDLNVYNVVQIGQHKAVILFMPAIGKISAAASARDCSHSFPNIQLVLLTGICGGIPSPYTNAEIILGDVVISDRLVFYDVGRQLPGVFERKNRADDNARKPPREIAAFLSKMKTRSGRARLSKRMVAHLDWLRHESPYGDWAIYPGVANDLLFEATYDHKHRNRDCDECGSAKHSVCEAARNAHCTSLHCDTQRTVGRKRHSAIQDKNWHQVSEPAVHFGAYASGDKVMRSGKDRDEIGRREKVIAFEMEGAGIWDNMPTIIVKGVCDYADSHKNKDWQKYAATTAAACVKALLQDWPVPNEVIVSTLNGSDAATKEGFLLQDWARIQPSQRDKLSVKLDSSYWAFDGRFESKRTSLSFELATSKLEDFTITELAIYPQKYASPETVRALRKRGEMLWKCRERHYISSIIHSDYGLQATVNSRFMVDMRTYNEMHSNNDDPPYIDQKRVYLDAKLMAEDQPELGDDFFLCLPTITFGYNMQKHDWVSLSIADIRDVEWNENAFELLVLEPTTKELVEAVVTHSILADEHTDLIQGKGNGLFLLLHGGPGTGKTLTAESVAEVAKRPLYRVTCGDIGTKAEEVEKYLESVLMLGKVWECVVLLDEADVFLEKRSLHHLERNAQVSVFLRVLEYYDGILILTSNRVGTFDEAFKSRIQLSLRYRDLDRDQREKIWANFITRLETLDTSNERDPNANVDISTTRPNVEVGIDTAGIRASLGKLAEYELNGREIRNAISTARQLAMFRKERMSFGHLDRVIGEASKFQEYTKALNQGFTADEISRHRGER